MKLESRDSRKEEPTKDKLPFTTAVFTLEVSADFEHRQEAENLGRESEKLAELWVRTCRPAKHKTSFFHSTCSKYRAVWSMRLQT